jgi:AP-3 complex subunit beta
MNFFNLISKSVEKETDKKQEKKPTQGMPKTESEMYTVSLSNQPIIALLKSDNENEKLKGMKILIAMQITRKDITPFVPYVVNLITNNFQVKKLCYFFLCYCSGTANTYILMSINTFHKDLTDSKVLTRASALRAFSSLRIDEILNVLTLSLQRGVSDFSIYVRRSACYALIKISEWEDIDMNLIIQLLGKLLSDSNVMVVGPALIAFNQICPEKLDLLHGHFRRIVRSLPQLEFIFIPNALQILTRYARIYLDKNFLFPEAKLEHDLKVLFETVETLLYYDSPSVLIASAEFFLFFKVEGYYYKSIIALLSFKSYSSQIAYIMLCLLLEYAKTASSLFSKIYSYFYLSYNETREILIKKLEILGVITSEINASVILKEITSYSGHENQEISTLSITTIGKICELNPSLSLSCTKHLITLLKSKSPYITSQVIIVMRKLINQDPLKYRKIIVHCAKNLENIQFPTARACALWIIGRYYQYIPTLACETIRQATLSFTKESTLVKHQIINSASKIYSETLNEQLLKVLTYLLELGFYDISYDIRDKCRLLSSIFITKTLALDSVEIFASTNEITSLKQETSAYVPVSLSYLTSSRIKGYDRYWDELQNKQLLVSTLAEDSSNLRDEEISPTLTVKQSNHYSNQDVSNVSGTGLKTRVVVNDPATLQAFLDEEEEESGEEYEEESEEEQDN